MVCLGLAEIAVERAPREQQDNREQQAPEVLVVLLATPELLVLSVALEHLGLLEQQVPLVTPVLRVAPV